MILTEESVQKIKEKAARYPRKKSAILPALTVAYRQVGHVDDEIYKEISKVIGIPTVEIAEAATFYTMFPKAPRGKYLLQVCNNISCALMGSDSMINLGALPKLVEGRMFSDVITAIGSIDIVLGEVDR